jgi:hypothetical protein
MVRRIALKRLTRSDLTIFDYHFRIIGAGNQKSVNLNKDVFENKLYPNLTEIAEEQDWEPFILNLTVLGPGKNHQPHTLPQKIIKGTSYKNWRLNGKLIQSPDSEERYASLEADDYAILEFIGVAKPTAIRMILVSQSINDDRALHNELASRYGSTSMSALDIADLESIINSVDTDLPQSHAARDFLDAFDLEDAALGGETGVKNLRKRRKARGVTQEELRKAKKAAEAVGRLGEVILNSYFGALKSQGELREYNWISNENAIAPYDFHYTPSIGSDQLIDVKSTAGPFTNPVHVSLAELLEMAESETDYRLYRLYEVKEAFARLRVSQPMKDFARGVLEKLNSLPDGVRSDSISIDPGVLDFGAEQTLDLNDEFERV